MQWVGKTEANLGGGKKDNKGKEEKGRSYSGDGSHSNLGQRLESKKCEGVKKSSKENKNWGVLRGGVVGVWFILGLWRRIQATDLQIRGISRPE